jgi:hypothetical protein
MPASQLHRMRDSVVRRHDWSAGQYPQILREGSIALARGAAVPRSLRTVGW